MRIKLLYQCAGGTHSRLLQQEGNTRPTRLGRQNSCCFQSISFLGVRRRGSRKYSITVRVPLTK